LENYDEWKNDKLFLKDVAEMLDNVLEYFISNASIQSKEASILQVVRQIIGYGTLDFMLILTTKRNSI
jgi:ribonucleoside-diphosphate reductase alpha chain